LGECRFVPRTADSPEGEGWLIGVATNRAAGRSELLIADAARLADGSLARALLPFPAAPQVHGNWVPAGSLDMGGT
jgi:carotenoid cleavage dioxygenase